MAGKTGKKKKDGLFDRKRVYTKDSWDLDVELQPSKSNKHSRYSSSVQLNVGQRVENGLFNVGEIVEQKTDALKKKSKNVRNFLRNNRDRNVSRIVDRLVPPKLVSWTIKIVIGVYGFIGVICLVLLILYAIDHLASTVYSDYTSYDWVFLYIIIGIITLGTFIGMYGTFKFGEFDDHMKLLQTENAMLSDGIKTVKDSHSVLTQQVTAFETEVHAIMDNKQDLQSQIKAFARLENELKRESQSNNREIMDFLKQVQTLFREFKILQIMVEKANLLQLFYELEFRGDDDAGLNREEFDIFLARLDATTSRKFKTFDEMDKNRDGTIDILEFQHELDCIYEKTNGTALRASNGKSKKTNQSAKLDQWKKWLT